MFTVAAWVIWNQQNAVVFGNPTTPSQGQHLHIKQEMERVVAAFNKEWEVKLGVFQPRPEEDTGWRKPPEGWLFCNTDAARTDSTGATGIAAVIRDHTGQWLSGKAERMHKDSMVGAELQDILLGLELVHAGGGGNFILCSDSKLTID